MEYFWFLAIVCLVVAAGGKIVEFSYNSLINKNSYTLIAPFDVAGGNVTNGEAADALDGAVADANAGSSEVRSNEGLVLASALQAKLYEITKEQEAVVSALTSPASWQPDESAIAFKDQIAFQTGEIVTPPMNLEVFRLEELRIQIAGVEVGGMFNWVYRTLAERSALKFSVTKTDKGAVVAGQLLRDGSSAMYAAVENSNQSIVEAVAYSLYREQLAATIPQIKVLEWKDLKRIHAVTMDLAGLKGAKISPDRPPLDYPQESEAFKQIIKKAPTWRELLLIGAELARQAREFDLSEHYLRRALELTDAKQQPDDYKAIEDSIKHLKDSVGIDFANVLNSLKSDPTPVYAGALAAHRFRLEVQEGHGRRPPVVAIFGGVPFRDQVFYDYAISPNNYLANRDVEAFVDTLALIVKSISPDAKIIFVARPKPPDTEKSSDDNDLINRDIAASLAILDKDHDPDILIFPFTKSIGNAEVDAALAKLEDDNCLIIAPVSSKGSPLNVPSLKPTIALVSATDVAGRPAYFSWRSDRVLWAPGTQIPALTATGEWAVGSSSAYAAAAAAGVAANVVSSVGEISPEALLGVLRETSRQIDPRDDGVRVLSQRAALDKAPAVAKPTDPTLPAAGTVVGGATTPP
jgi:hypothetical protein